MNGGNSVNVVDFETECAHAAQIGYMRISTDDQSHQLQEDALIAAGCTRIFADTASGARSDRPGLADALSYLRKGDTLVAFRLDRLGRSLPHLLNLVAELENRGIGLRSLCEAIDTTTPSGRLTLQIFGAISEFERNLLRERVAAGVKAARKRGRVGGRPRSVSAAMGKAILAMKGHGCTTSEILEAQPISRATLFRFLRDQRKISGNP